MPRSASEGGGGSSRLRNVFARSPLALAFSTDADEPSPAEPDAAKENCPKQPSWFGHNRGGEPRRSPPGLDQDGFRLPLWKRQRSKSHLERNRPLSLSKLSLHLSVETSVFLPTEPRSDATECPTSALAVEDSSGRVLYHGEVQITHSGWRKKFEYMVLTENQLFRFKNSRKASERFPWILPINAQMRRPESTASINSLYDLEPSSGAESPTDVVSRNYATIPLSTIIAVQLITENRNRVGLELVRQSQSFTHSTSLSISAERAGNQPHWLESLGSLARNLPQNRHGWFPPYLTSLIRDAVGADMEDTAESDESNLFLVHPRQRGLGDPSHSPLDELSKEPCGLAILVIGKHKVHIVTIPKGHRSSTRSVYELSNLQSTSHGIVNLTCISVRDRDDSFDLFFRQPQKPVVSFELASVHSHDIAQKLHRRLEMLQPNWKRSPFVFRVPALLQSKLISNDVAYLPSAETFSSILEAHCVAFDIELSNISYSIETDGEDSPRFQLLPPRSTRAADYTILELLAVMRSLRFNEFFVTISFANISLDRLGEAFDYFGDDHVCMKPKMGSSILVTFEEMKHSSLLIQELTALIITSANLRRLNFASSIRRIPIPVAPEQGDDRGCGIVEALYPLCVNQNTNVDWISLNGIHLSQTDFEFIMGMLAKRDCHLRAIEMSGCNLDTWSLRLLLGELPTQHNTLEAIDISNNPGRFSPDISFGNSYSQCQAMRMVDLSRLHATPEPVPLISTEVLFSWRLEEVRLSKTRINERTLETLINYLKHESSRPLRAIYVDGCQISAEGVAQLYTSVCEGAYMNSVRELHVDLSENRISPLKPIIAAIRGNRGPSSLALKLLEFEKASDFHAFVDALKTNTSLRSLDLSEALLDFRVDDEVASSIADMLRENTGLETLDLSGENSRLESSSLGPDGLAGALRGLQHNTRLRTLRLHDQRLGLRGANELADALRANTTLRELRCERNAVPLAGLVALVDALRHNRSLLALSDLDDCKRAALRAVRAAVDAMSHADAADAPTAARARSALGFMGFHHHSHSSSTTSGHHHHHLHHPHHQQHQQHQQHSHPRLGRSAKESRDALPSRAPDLAEATAIVAERWEAQQALMRRYLERNARLAAGEDAASLDDDAPVDDEAPVELASSPSAPSDGAADHAAAGVLAGSEEKVKVEADDAEGHIEEQHSREQLGSNGNDVGLAIAGVDVENAASGSAAVTQPATDPEK